LVDFLVVGGGISGMLVARELSTAGSVLVVEQGEIGREASWAGGGILSPLYPWRYSDAVTRLARLSQEGFARLAMDMEEDSGVSPEWTRSGLLVLELGDSEVAEQWAARFEVRLEVLGAEGLHACEPRLAGGIGEGIWMPEVAQVRNPRLVRALRGSLLARGVELREHTRVTGMQIRDGRIEGVRTDSGAISAGVVVVAGGAWSGQAWSGLEKVLEVGPVRGQMVLFKTEPGLISRIVLRGNRYLIPRRDGRVLVGSTLESVGFDKSVSDQARQELVAVAKELAPVLGRYPVEHHWAGLRPSSPGGVPYIGPSSETEGLFVNAGHFRNGVVLGPASAGLLADLVLGRTPRLDPAPYALDAPRPRGDYP
jgi:glycine oxidase